MNRLVSSNILHRFTVLSLESLFSNHKPKLSNHKAPFISKSKTMRIDGYFKGYYMNQLIDLNI
jgi:hypothetical protein